MIIVTLELCSPTKRCRLQETKLELTNHGPSLYIFPRTVGLKELIDSGQGKSRAIDLKFRLDCSIYTKNLGMVSLLLYMFTTFDIFFSQEPTPQFPQFPGDVACSGRPTCGIQEKCLDINGVCPRFETNPYHRLF